MVNIFFQLSFQYKNDFNNAFYLYNLKFEYIIYSVKRCSLFVLSLFPSSCNLTIQCFFYCINNRRIIGTRSIFNVYNHGGLLSNFICHLCLRHISLHSSLRNSLRTSMRDNFNLCFFLEIGFNFIIKVYKTTGLIWIILLLDVALTLIIVIFNIFIIWLKHWLAMLNRSSNQFSFFSLSTPLLLWLIRILLWLLLLFWFCFYFSPLHMIFFL